MTARLLLLLTMLLVAAPATGEEATAASQRYFTAVRKFADPALERGRDKYGKQHTPLFVDGLNVDTFEPVRWKKRGETWVLCNFASQQSLMRTLDGLTAITGESRYCEAAEAATRHVLKHLRAPNGVINWGGHMAWDLESERAVGEYADVHEQKNHQPYYPLFWRVDPAATREVIEAIWTSHVLDWSLLDYNRHATMSKRRKIQWDYPFNEKVEVPFASIANNLSFVNVTPPLLDASVALATLGKDKNALLWSRRLAYRWQQARDPKTGLSGGQLSYRKEDRAFEALGHLYPDINEAKIVATYHRVNRYHDLPLAQLQAGAALLAAGGDFAKVGREFIAWASDDLKTYARNCYDPQTAQFKSMLTDGTPIQWEQAKAGYYDSSSFAPGRADGDTLWGNALAYRLTRDAAHWQFARQFASALNLGDIGGPRDRKRQLRLDTAAGDWRLIYGVLDLHRATRDQAFLKLASRIGDNLLAMQHRSGLFPRGDLKFARVSDEIPLALLHLAAALAGKESKLPPPMLDNAYFHCEFDGAEVPKKPGIEDNRTYDSSVFYGGY